MKLNLCGGAVCGKKKKKEKIKESDSMPCYTGRVKKKLKKKSKVKKQEEEL